MQNVSGETLDAVSVRKSLSKLCDFQSVTASPYRVLHQAQGDKQENPSGRNHHRKLMEIDNGTMHLFRGIWVYLGFFYQWPQDFCDNSSLLLPE